MRLAMLAGLICCLLTAPSMAADDEKESRKIQGAGGEVSMDVPGEWMREQPAVRIIEHEFSAPAAEGDSSPGRLTMMAAGGSVKDNLNRWIGQFETAGAKSDRKDFTVDGMKIHQIDLRGTYNDRRGPFAPAVKRPDYRMLGAIIEMKSGGLYFLKFFGPNKTIGAHEKAFQEMIASLKSN